MMSDEEASKKQRDDKIVTAPSASKAVSFHNTLVLYVVVLGLGAIVGYRCFASIYNQRCSDIIDETEKTFARHRDDLNNQVKEALERGNAQDESELLELRGRLSKQEALIENYEKQEKKDSDAILQLELNNDQYKGLLAEHQKRALDMESKLSLVAAENESMLKRIEEQVRERVKQADTDLYTVHVQNLHTTLTQEKFGDGPYYVQFDVDIDGEMHPGAFLVEISTLGSMPTSVFSFLTLVGNGIYQEAEFLSTQSIIHVDSDEEKVNSLGYAISGLKLAEDSSVGPCAPYSLGFVGANGGLKIIMTSDSSKHGTLACFGSITQGRQTMSLIQRAAKEGKTISVLDARVVTMDSRPSVNEGEL